MSSEASSLTGPVASSSLWLATAVAGARERQLAQAVVLASLLIFVLSAPWAQRQLPPVWTFMPIYESALVLIDLITALLLFGQFRIVRSRALLLLACGYLFTALTTVAHGLSFPGLFAAGGLLGAGPQSTAWLYMFWHGGFPLFVAVYAWQRRVESSARLGGAAVIAAAVAVAAGVAGFVLLATTGHDLLPQIMQGNRYTPAMVLVVSAVWLASVAALALLWWRRPHSVLDLWLMVVLCAWLFDIALSALLNAGRFDLGFYVGRIYGLLAAGAVLAALLLENGRLYARLAALNTELDESNRQLQEQTRLKSEFLANMSHELRTPLNAVIGFAEMLKEGVAGDADKQRRFAGHIFQSGHHLLSLINDILDLSKIEAGKAEIVPSPVALDAALSDAVALLAPQARARRVELLIEPHGELGTLQADERRLKQILLNLVSNAMKFTPEGGQVRLGARRVDRAHAAGALPGFAEGARLPLPEGDAERFVEISVSDSGIGIAPADMRRLFSPFTQIPNALTRREEGTGLGLVMVHRLAQLHGGTVAVTSESGRGSCFTVWLPWRDEGSASPAAAERRMALVVEDDDNAAALMRAQLEAEGFAVRRVVSAEQALALVGECTPDLITLDILLPGIDGWQFLARLKETPAWEAVPVVVVSVVADRGKGFSLGAALVLQKPIAGQALATGLRRLGLVPGGGRDVTVLVVDDDPGAVELVASQLHERGYLVLRALGGREGIELARRYRPDLIALDLEMPGVNGFDVVEALRGEASTSHIPIVVVTAKELSPGDRQQLNGHILDIVGKAEFNHGRFIGEVQRALARAQ